MDFTRAEAISIHAPLAGRDAGRPGPCRRSGDFNPRAPRGARQVPRGCCLTVAMISIHAPLAGRDGGDSNVAAKRHPISIHAPLAGRDSWAWTPAISSTHFNPRAPRGARPGQLSHSAPLYLFQSTRPSRGATQTPVDQSSLAVFQSTRPSRGATCNAQPCYECKKFQSTRPSRGATLRLDHYECQHCISIHAPLAGRDLDLPPFLMTV